MPRQAGQYAPSKRKAGLLPQATCKAEGMSLSLSCIMSCFTGEESQENMLEPSVSEMPWRPGPSAWRPGPSACRVSSSARVINDSYHVRQSVYIRLFPPFPWEDHHGNHMHPCHLRATDDMGQTQTDWQFQFLVNYFCVAARWLTVTGLQQQGKCRFPSIE
jgi:hypothetical protein